MQLTIKTLSQSTFKVDIELDKTVKDLKEKIEKDHGKEYPVSAQKLIYSGKILADENKLSEYQIDEKKFVVLMITRPPPVQKAEKATTQTTTQSEPSKQAKTEEKSRPTTRSSTTTTAAPSAAGPVTTQSTATTNPTNPASSQTGAASANNTTTTTTTTTTNNRQSTTGRSSMAASAAAAAAAAAAAGGAPSSQDQQLMQRLATLMNQPQFRQIQDMIQQSPHLLSTTIEALAGSDPEMYNFISENPDIFVTALNHPPQIGARSSSRRSNVSGTTTAPGGHHHQQGSQQAAAAAPRQVPVEILVSEHDKEAIERLKELGFSEFQAIQAYMACDKDEQLAANLLFQMEQ